MGAANVLCSLVAAASTLGQPAQGEVQRRLRGGVGVCSLERGEIAAAGLLPGSLLKRLVALLSQRGGVGGRRLFRRLITRLRHRRGLCAA